MRQRALPKIGADDAVRFQWRPAETQRAVWTQRGHSIAMTRCVAPCSSAQVLTSEAPKQLPHMTTEERHLRTNSDLEKVSRPLRNAFAFHGRRCPAVTSHNASFFTTLSNLHHDWKLWAVCALANTQTTEAQESRHRLHEKLAEKLTRKS